MHIQVDDREFNTILASLSLWQYLVVPEQYPGIDGHRLRQLREIASEDGEMMNHEEIEELAQRMNMGDIIDDAPFLTLGDVVQTIVHGLKDIKPDDMVKAKVRARFELTLVDYEKLPDKVKDTLIMLMATESSTVPVALKEKG